MIKVFLIVNSSGKIRIRRFYDEVEFARQQQIEQKLVQLTSKLSPNSCNFFKDLDGIYDKKCKIVMRFFGTLYFIAVIDEDESELGVLDLIQNIVDLMDKIFENACELDVLYHPDKMNALIDEIIVAGIVVETNIMDIQDALKQQETQIKNK
ncbi:unnamed protein product [Paramecium octaurelia]|uniref:AP complex subunit sigma n=1 Tax=Paramecium octaurelia TaxID=43137 RepID=A0A8S1TQG8_PAROT|nr:unnamed protein product [Paramecium octaurelia]